MSSVAKYVLALDQGTTSSRAIIFDKKGNIVGKAQNEFEQIYPQAGWVEHDPLAILYSQFQAVSSCILSSGVNPCDIAGIGITNQRETTILWDRQTGKPVYNAIVWQCRRTAELCEELKAQGLEDYIKEKTGLLIDAYFSATKIKWILDNVAGARELAGTGLKRLGVIATKCSVESGAFQRELLRLRPDAEVTALACPEFVPMIERGHYTASDAEVRKTVAESLRPLKEAGVEALLLGCTHYGLIAEAISDYLGEDVALIGAADASARVLKAYIEAEGMQADGGDEQYYTSGSVEDFTALAPIMLGYGLRSEVRYVEPFPLEEK